MKNCRRSHERSAPTGTLATEGTQEMPEKAVKDLFTAFSAQRRTVYRPKAKNALKTAKKGAPILNEE